MRLDLPDRRTTLFERDASYLPAESAVAKCNKRGNSMLNNVCHFEIPAHDVASLRGFYNDLFGWTSEKMEGPFDCYLINSPGEPKGGMTARQSPEHGPTDYVQVESIEDSLKKAQELGAYVVVPKSPVPGMGWFAVLTGPQKNLLGLWQDDPKAS
jgi:uncharacterized protein